jgi:3-hydroxyisobutyrate dehydrogenase-like beta-hydroxyacid dehydrogenase
LARALIVGCGCRGRALGTRLRDAGWQVRGTTRDETKLEEIAAAGIEGAVADPDRVGTIMEAIEGVTLVFWSLASASGDDAAVAALHGPRLERLLEEVVDTPVRGLVYEAAGTVTQGVLLGGEAIVNAAAERWRIPVVIVDADPGDSGGWLDAMFAAAERLTAAGRPG